MCLHAIQKQLLLIFLLSIIIIFSLFCGPQRLKNPCLESNISLQAIFATPPSGEKLSIPNRVHRIISFDNILIF